jgi:VWFA-related protein
MGPAERCSKIPHVLGVAGLCFWAAGLAGGAAGGEKDARVEITPRSLSRRPPAAHGDIRLDVKLVLIPVTVTDRLGAPFPGLPAEAFRLFEDGVEQQLKYFSTQDAPVSLGIVFDASRSMAGKLEGSRAAMTQFFRMARSGDEFFLVEFSDAPQLLCDFTTDTGRIEQILAGLQPKSWTALLDAVYLAVQHLKRAKNSRRSLLILSDGGDNNSRYTESEMKTIVREADVCIYSIGLAGGAPLLRRHLRLLRQLSEETGGRLREVDRLDGLPEAVANISAAMRNQYLLGYLPNNKENNGLYRKVQVRLNQPPDSPRLHASWRTGYYAPLAQAAGR